MLHRLIYILTSFDVDASSNEVSMLKCHLHLDVSKYKADICHAIRTGSVRFFYLCYFAVGQRGEICCRFKFFA